MNAETDGLIRRWFREVWNERRDEAIAELAHPRSVAHHDGRPAMTMEDFRVFRRQLLTLVPDARVEIMEVLSDDGQAVARWRCHGTTAGPVPQPMEFTGMSWMKIANGQLVEAFDAYNPAALAALQAPA